MAKVSTSDQIKDLITQATAVAVCIPAEPSTDAIASALAVAAVLEKRGTRSRVVASGFSLPQNHRFLPKSDEIFSDLTALRQFVIRLDTSKTAVEELSYDAAGKQLEIFISPKDGFFSDADITTSAGNFSYDLIIVLDSQDLDTLGAIYDQNTDFFYHTPVINIDHSPANDHFGQVNLVNITATSTSEMLFELVRDWGDDLLDEYIATNLLTGMISKTKSFRTGSVTPRSLAIASHLISQGARREDIVKHLYQSKQVSTLRLWGKVLSQLESDQASDIVWSCVTAADITAAGAKPSELPDVIDELIINTPDAKNVCVFRLGTDTVDVHLSTAPYIDAKKLFTRFQPTGTPHFIHFSLPGTDWKKIKTDVFQAIRSASSTA